MQNTKRYGLITIKEAIEKLAYEMWVAGSTDPVKNWYEAERIVLARLTAGGTANA